MKGITCSQIHRLHEIWQLKCEARMNVEKKGYVTRMGVSKSSCWSSSDGSAMLKLFDGIQAEQVWVFDFRVVNLKC